MFYLGKSSIIKSTSYVYKNTKKQTFYYPRISVSNQQLGNLTHAYENMGLVYINAFLLNTDAV